VAVASARPYANLHPITLIFTGRMPFLPSNQQRQGTEGSIQCQTYRHTYIYTDHATCGICSNRYGLKKLTVQQLLLQQITQKQE